MTFSSLLYKAVLFAYIPCLWIASPVLQASASDVQRKATSSGTPAHATDLSVLDQSNLVDQKGHRFSSGKLIDDLVLVNFIFTHCSTSCPVQTEQLVSVMQGLPEDVRRKVAIISVSVDPANDTPSTLRAYAKHQGADMKNWYFLTGKTQDVGQLTKALGIFATGATSPNVGQHTTDIRLFDRQGRFRQRYSGVPVDKQRLTAEMQAMLSATPLKAY